MARRESDIRFVVVVVSDHSDDAHYRNISVAALREVFALPVDKRRREFLGRSFRVAPSMHRETWSACLDLTSGMFAWSDMLEALVDEGLLDRSSSWVSDAIEEATALRVLEA